jgi:hypothetical protein
MKCTAMVLSLVMFSTACRADAPATPPAPSSQPAPARVGAGTGGAGAKNWAQYRPGASVGGGRSGGNTAVSTDGDGWVMVRRSDANRPTEKGAYLGLSVTSVPTVLRDQLKLQRGVGLVVNFVDKDSPAEAAGFKQSDVLQKLDEQILINSQQFAVLLRTHDINQEVRFTIIREAKPIELSAKLVEREMALLDETNTPGRGTLSLMGEGSGLLDYPKASDLAARSAYQKLKSFGLETSDEKHSFSISQLDGHRNLVARDKGGKILFEGPIDTEEQIEKLPEEIRGKIRDLPMGWPGRNPLATQPSLRVLPAVPMTPPASSAEPRR